VQTKDKTGRADIALNLINRLFGIERSLPVLAQLTEGSLSLSNASPPLSRQPHKEFEFGYVFTRGVG
jgi:hypothetical protein